MIQLNARSVNEIKHMHEVGEKVRAILEKEYKLDINTTEKILETYLSTDFLPRWYFFSTPANEIADHFVIISQMLDSDHEYLQQVSSDGYMVTYFINVGRDFPGRLEKIIRENVHAGISSYDSVKTRSGIRIVTIEIANRPDVIRVESDQEQIEYLRGIMIVATRNEHLAYSNDFMKSLSGNYLREEMETFAISGRMLRHARAYEEVRRGCPVFVSMEDCTDPVGDEKLVVTERRITIATSSPCIEFVLRVLEMARSRNINLLRSYYDCFSHQGMDVHVGIISLYLDPSIPLAGFVEELLKMPAMCGMDVRKTMNHDELQLEQIIRSLSVPGAERKVLESSVEVLKKLVAGNSDPSSAEDSGSFLLNAISDFFDGAQHSGLDRSPEVMARMLAFDNFEEFLVPVKTETSTVNQKGFRIKHNAARGPYKGGLRIDPIVEFTEVAALSFMMTWKCARSRILFGGGKGGLVLNPREYDKNSITYFDTINNFGRSLFMVTGPMKDVPAGDVGCGSREIDVLFEGFKSSTRHLALMAHGSKKHVGLIGNNRVVSIEQARGMLRKNFEISLWDDTVLHELASSERYLNLVCAAQITGKDHFGIQARAGATGRGLRFAILAMVVNLYIDNAWEPYEALSPEEVALLRRLTAFTGDSIVQNHGYGVIGEDEWHKLETVTFLKLLKNKRVVVQGSGKVGGSLLMELERYEVNVIAVADAGGAVIGENLDVRDLLHSVDSSREHPDCMKRSTVVGATKNVTEAIIGADLGAAVLELDCDILVPAALENAITKHNAPGIRARIIACGSNGTATPSAQRILEKRGIVVIYDFLANQSGVNASYFEWLRNLTERFRYEAEVIHNSNFDFTCMDDFIMPEFHDRIIQILSRDESHTTTTEWNALLRDIMWAAVNEDYRDSKIHHVSMKTVGFANAQMRVLAAMLLRMTGDERRHCWETLSSKTRELLIPVFDHPESSLINRNADVIVRELKSIKINGD